MIPPVTPPIIFSDKKRYRIKVGRNTITTAANIPAQLPVYCIDWSIPYYPTATGRNVSLFAKINDRKYSFQILIKLKIVTVTIPDRAIGNIIFQNVFVGGQPSIAAASSYVRDRFEKNVSRKIVVYGILIPIYRKINVTLLANTLFKIPRFATILNSGSTIMVIGIPIADTKLV